MFVLARSDQEEGEQGESRAGGQDRQGQHPETGDCGEREPTQHGSGERSFEAPTGLIHTT